MKCPKCLQEGLKFLEKKNKSGKSSGSNTRWNERQSNKARCKKCGYEGYS